MAARPNPDIMKFRLEIYTYPACRGFPCGNRESYHSSVEEARLHLEAQREPYAYAVLSRHSDWTTYPVSWKTGVSSINNDECIVNGTNREHPAYYKLMDDLDNLIDLVEAEHKKTGEGTVYIAERLLNERHPVSIGWAEKVANLAFERGRKR